MTINSLLVFFIIVFLLAAGAGLIVLQVYLSKKESRWPGLILPFINLAVTILIALGLILFSVSTSTSTVTETINGEEVAVSQTDTQAVDTSPVIIGALFTFLQLNIPTVVFLIIYFACRSKYSKQKALQKMSAQDLE